jgi:hypothetical protein
MKIRKMTLPQMDEELSKLKKALDEGLIPHDKINRVTQRITVLEFGIKRMNYLYRGKPYK